MLALDLVLCVPLVCIVADSLAGSSNELYPEALMVPLPPDDAGWEFRSIED